MEVCSHDPSNSNPVGHEGQPLEAGEEFLVEGMVKWSKVCEREGS